ncbi:MAG: iron-containing alcohol dehydrogenase [Halioglobus sp.]
MSMFVRKLKHSMLIGLMKTLSGLAPAASYMAFAGSGSSRQLCEHIMHSGAKRVLIVTDAALRELGVVDQAIAALNDAGIELAVYDGVLPNPSFTHVAEGVAMLKQAGSEVVLAIGGGSSIDAAKIIAAAATNAGNPQDWIGHGKIKEPALPIYAIPTTAGTGSEATMGAVISNPDSGEKGVIAGATLLPSACAIDSDVMLGLPASITAATGMDALTHAIEAYIGIWDRGTRTENSRAAISLIFENLETACSDGTNRAARDAMAMAAYYAGMAINQVNVGNVHAIAHQLGGKYGIPHGLANALVLPHVLEFCREDAQPQLAELARLIGVGESGASEEQLAYSFIAAVKDLRTAVHIPDKSDQIKAQDYDYLTDLAVAEGGSYPVPRLLDRDSTIAILTNITA